MLRVGPEDVLSTKHACQWVQHASRLGLDEWIVTLALEASNAVDTEFSIQKAGMDAAFKARNKLAFLQLTENRLKDDPENASVHRSLAQWHIREGEHLHAAQFLARSLQSEPGHVPTLKLLAQCFHLAGELESEKLTYEEIERIQNTKNDTNEEFAVTDTTTADLKETLTETKEQLTEPWVTALVSAYASESFMDACLQNLTRQTLGERLEILVIDSGSPENEGEIVRRYQEKHSNIRYIRTAERESLYEAWNRGVREARGQYIVNANTDDAHRDDAFEMLVHAMEQNQGVGLAYGDCIWTSKPNDQFPSEHILKEVRYPDYHPGLSLFYCYTACLQFWRKSTLTELGLFDTRWKAVGDYEILMRAAKQGVKVLHVPELLSLFYQNTEGITQQSDLSANEEQEVRNEFRSNIDIATLYGLDPSNPQLIALAWSDLAELAFEIRVPWHEADQGDNAFTIQCLQQSLQLMPDNESAAGNLLWLLGQYDHLEAGKMFLLELSEYWTVDALEALTSISTYWNAASETRPVMDKTGHQVGNAATLVPSDISFPTPPVNDSVNEKLPETINWHAPFFNPSG